MSAQHERIRAMGAGFEEIGLRIWRYGDNDDRSITVYTEDDLDLIPYAELVAETTEVYRLLAVLVAERDEELKRSAYGRRGPLI
jgi:hypothetical protein